MQEEALEATIDVYPNPSNGQFTLSASGIYGEVSITILDAMGRVILEENNVVLNESTRTLDLSKEGKGIYFLRFSSKDGDVIKRLIKN